MGNPHLVFFVNDLQTIDIKRMGPILEHHNFFPKRVNVEFAQIMDQHNIILKIWERGAGLTHACGSGACATFSAARSKGLVAEKVNVNLPGGRLIIEQSQNDILMTGPVALSYVGEITL